MTILSHNKPATLKPADHYNYEALTFSSCFPPRFGTHILPGRQGRFLSLWHRRLGLPSDRIDIAVVERHRNALDGELVFPLEHFQVNLLLILLILLVPGANTEGHMSFGVYPEAVLVRNADRPDPTRLEVQCDVRILPDLRDRLYSEC